MKKYQLTEHFFGPPPHGKPSLGEKLCSEPPVHGAKIHRVYHLTFELIRGGNAKCLHCGEEFFEKDTPT